MEHTMSSCVCHRGLHTSDHLVKHSGPGGRSSRCHICNRVQRMKTVGCALSPGRSTVPWRLLAAGWEDATRHVWGLLRYTYRTLLAHSWITDIMSLFCEGRFIGEKLNQKRGRCLFFNLKLFFVFQLAPFHKYCSRPGVWKRPQLWRNKYALPFPKGAWE